MKQLPTIRPTTRKFYNKWYNKLSFFLPGGRLLSFYDTAQIVDFMSNPDKLYYGWQKLSIKDVNRAKRDWLKFIFLLNSIPNGQYQKRSESDLVNIYTNDENFIEAVKKDLPHRIKEIYEPAEGTLELLDSEEKVLLVNKLPYNKYNFRVIIKPHKLNSVQREQFVQFLENNPGIGLQDNVKEFIFKNDINWDRRYIYVDTEKTLTMLRIACADAVSTIHRYVINDK